MVPGSPDGFQASPRLKQALVADLVMQEDDRSNDHLLTDRMNDNHELTENLARQLSLTYYSPAGIHDTLLVVIVLIDELLRGVWPPPHTPEDCQPIAVAATKNLDGYEVYATLLAGPGRWRNRRIQDGVTVSSLPATLKPILATELATELSQMFSRWVQWDIRDLRGRRDEAIKAKQAAEAEQREAERKARPARKRPTPAEIAARRQDNPVASYQPKGRT
ncbi:MAG: hypothetical protein ACLP5O_18420 [Acidimicrobiales bacterium]